MSRRKAVHVTINALAPRGDAAPLLAGPGTTRVRDGLRTFDSLADEVRRRQDALRPTGPAPGTAHGAGAGTALGAALAAYLATPAGQKTLDGFAHAAVGLAQKFFAFGPEQLPLPLS